MAKIVELEIKNFRGISSYHQRLNREVICFLGRGDSRKTTILDAIKAVLSPLWNHSFYDTDFFKLNSENPIEIIASIASIPESLLAEHKYGLWIRTLCRDTGIVTDDITKGDITVLTVKLTVGSDLEPSWTVINGRAENEISISANDRSKFNCFMVSDSIDGHFSWSKGSPLNSLLKVHTSEAPKKKIVLDAIREAKEKIDKADYAHYSGVMEAIQKQAVGFGLNLEEVQTTIDFKDINLHEGKVSLHKEDVPFRLMGKGSKRLASMAIQTAISREGGIVLIDEIEQGLEPDRVRQVARTLKDENKGQVIITSHSREVAVELEAKDLSVVCVNRNSGEVRSSFLDVDNSGLQGLIRACPDAFFSQKVIVCEGATEVGVCRALDVFRLKQGREPMTFNGCAYVDGTGHSFTDRALNTRKAGLEVSVLCDSDTDQDLKPQKKDLLAENISIFECEDGNSFEDQCFNDLPWEAIDELINYVLKVHNKTDESLLASVKAKYPGEFPENWRQADTPEVRSALAKVSVTKQKEWFKRVGHGEKLGEVIFKYFENMNGTHLHKILSQLDKWIG
ncbi:ATP-dependent nuclease [Alteromonas naphthalenivorans]|uniref:ATPase AAA-type core domain-containing protein n=1 Tax=Alteromonas naphthalenivorans TaxID=715451 RepID=F5Z428_ALTNA|nr:ATP-binding protein [Alteromonas naphthalenivorans]AEF02610.1 hypothetical protein ambt_05310 [Alteromonas naphthalenivorans]